MKEPVKVKNAGENGSKIRDALKKLGLKDVSGKNQMPGAEFKLKVTEDTIEKLEKLKGKTFSVDGEGKVKLK